MYSIIISLLRRISCYFLGFLFSFLGYLVENFRYFRVIFCLCLYLLCRRCGRICHRKEGSFLIFLLGKRLSCCLLIELYLIWILRSRFVGIWIVLWIEYIYHYLFFFWSFFRFYFVKCSLFCQKLVYFSIIQISFHIHLTTIYEYHPYPPTSVYLPSSTGVLIYATSTPPKSNPPQKSTHTCNSKAKKRNS